MKVYEGICSNAGKAVPENEAFDYAMENIKSNPKDRAEFIEWFYSGEWVKREAGECELND